MHDVQMKVADNGRGSFFIEAGLKKIAEMVVAVHENDITVFHTEVTEEFQGSGIAAQLLFTLVNFAQESNKKVIPLCAYVRGQFEKHPEQYADIWKKDWHNRNRGE